MKFASHFRPLRLGEDVRHLFLTTKHTNYTKSNCHKRTHRAQKILDCGGKRSATPLWAATSIGVTRTKRKAPSPLRSAGALHNLSVFFAFSRGNSLRKALAVIGSQRQPPFHFIRFVRVHPVIKFRPLRVGAIQFFGGEFARVSAPPRLSGEVFQCALPVLPRDAKPALLFHYYLRRIHALVS